jgi:hypothetical protein
MNRLLVLCPFLVALLSSTFLANDCHAGVIYGSGYGVNPNLGGQRDANWKIVAVPSSFTPPDSQSTPYFGYIPKYIAPVFYGSIDGTYQWPLGELQSGYLDSNTGHISYWLTPNNSDTTASIAQGSYNWIAAQTFTAETPGTYHFIFPISGDNEIKFFIDGSINTSNPDFPSITGGTQIGQSWNNFSAIGTISGDVYLTAGLHTAYMVLYDFGGDTGALIGTASFSNTSPVPEPNSLAIFGVLVVYPAMRRWKKSRTT